MTDENLKNIQRAIDEIWDGYNNSVQHDLKKILGVNNLTNNYEVKKQYARRILLVHPDKFSGIESKIDFHGQEHDFFFKILNRAKEIAFDSSLLGQYENMCYIYSNKRIDLFSLKAEEKNSYNNDKFAEKAKFNNGKYAPGFSNTGNNFEEKYHDFFEDFSFFFKNMNIPKYNPDYSYNYNYNYNPNSNSNYNYNSSYKFDFDNNFKCNNRCFDSDSDKKICKIFISVIIIVIIIGIFIKIIRRRRN
ncbi:hypothetical protein DMUE_4108 [Dictyocoela muelleri]|nr:hypothetical protein DMUE_4108 [Dictyocoela muelleri]